MLEAIRKAVGLLAKPTRSIGKPELLGALRCKGLGRIDIALHLGERDRPARQWPIGMKDGVMRILPALVDQPLLAVTEILDEAILIRIAGPSIQSNARCIARPELFQRLEIAARLA